MRPKRERHRLDTMQRRQVSYTPEQHPVPAMYPVETADSDYRTLKIQIPDVSINCQIAKMMVVKIDDKGLIFFGKRKITD